ncbi:MAG TPA: hypothetical protein VFY29_16570, partial [Terriglobia bacterium]|nr:hypothetical protein [Terriglobia bacterium]
MNVGSAELAALNGNPETGVKSGNPRVAQLLQCSRLRFSTGPDRLRKRLSVFIVQCSIEIAQYLQGVLRRRFPGPTGDRLVVSDQHYLLLAMTCSRSASNSVCPSVDSIAHGVGVSTIKTCRTIR